MKNVTLYKYTRDGGGVTVSPIKPDTDYTTLSRLIADEGKILVNGETRTVCIDTDTTDGWTEEPMEETSDGYEEEPTNTKE